MFAAVIDAVVCGVNGGGVDSVGVEVAAAVGISVCCCHRDSENDCICDLKQTSPTTPSATVRHAIDIKAVAGKKRCRRS